jgi:large subunit ribosomal protein L4
VSEEVDQNLHLASRNVKALDVRDVEGLDPVSLISHDKVLITVPALKKLEGVLA